MKRREKERDDEATHREEREQASKQLSTAERSIEKVGGELLKCVSGVVCLEWRCVGVAAS